MVTIHRTTISATCPHGGKDSYQAEFHVGDRMLKVEEIQEAIDILTQGPIYQESLTKKLADALACRVVTDGRHGRFDTECSAEPE